MRIAVIASAVCVVLGSTVSVADNDSAQLTAEVQPNCNVEGVDSLVFNEVVSGSVATDPVVTILCNDADGANLSLRSSEGGLESDDNEDQEIEYIARLSNEVIGGGALELDTGIGGQGNNDVESETILTAGAPLAEGRSGELTVTLSDSATFAGGYSDTLQINVEAK